MSLADGRIRMQRISVTAESADRESVVIELLFEFFDRRRALQRFEPAVRAARVISRAKFHCLYTQPSELAQHIVERQLPQQRGKYPESHPISLLLNRLIRGVAHGVQPAFRALRLPR